MPEKKGSETLIDIGKVLLLVGVGYYLTKTAVEGWAEVTEGPIIIGDDKEAGLSREATIALPPFFVPYNPGDTQESVIRKYKPKISIEGLNWVFRFNPITIDTDIASMTYTPDPVVVPIVRTMDMVELVAKLTPEVTQTSDPVGWIVQFPTITILA